MPTGRRMILHIGGEKTGSTTLQATLAVNREALAAEGVLYSRVAGALNHTLLALHASEGRGTRDLRTMAGLAGEADFAAFQQDFPARLRAEAEGSGARILLFSCEHLSSRLRDAAAVGRLLDLLRPLADEVRLVYYARPQEELVVSAWSTMVKSGDATLFSAERVMRLGTPLDHLAVVECWAAHLPDSAWLLRPYQPAALAGGDIVEDFLATTGLPATALPRRLPRLNRSLDATTAEFLRLYNAATGAGPGRPPTPARGRLIRLLEEMSEGPALRLPADEAAEVAARFAEGNGAVARRLLGRDALFTPVPPGAAEAPSLTTGAALRIAARLWQAAQETAGPEGPAPGALTN